MPVNLLSDDLGVRSCSGDRSNIVISWCSNCGKTLGHRKILNLGVSVPYGARRFFEHLHVMLNTAWVAKKQIIMVSCCNFWHESPKTVLTFPGYDSSAITNYCNSMHQRIKQKENKESKTAHFIDILLMQPKYQLHIQILSHLLLD